MLTKTIQYSYSIKNKTNRAIRNARFWTFAPVKKTPIQKCDEVDASYPFDLIVDDSGNQVMSFVFREIPPFGTKIISIKAVLSMSDFPNCSGEEKKNFLAPEKYVESTAPEVVETGKLLDDKTDVKTSEKIFNWVANNIHYVGFESEERGALAALKSGEGDCTEFMRLFVALCRTNGIPARSIGGYICRKNNIITPVDYHNWAEFYIGGTWHTADPQKKVFMENIENYIAMQIINESSSRLMKGFRRYRFEGEGLVVKMNS